MWKKEKRYSCLKLFQSEIKLERILWAILSTFVQDALHEVVDRIP